ncbi:MAG: hypothetical protein KDD47_11570 [Acidobacteria bacterium]|nr:hypothetical protein [Acidobacteriota bacterium]
MSEPVPVDRLFFVYRADAGRVDALLDSARKLLGIDACALCSITHGLIGEKGEWQGCRERLGVPVEAVHRNELAGALAAAVGDRLPCVVAEVAGELRRLLEPDELEACRGSIEELERRLQRRAQGRGLEFPGLEERDGP